MDTQGVDRTRNGLTLLEAERRIEALEAAAAKALLVLAEAVKHKNDIDKQGEHLLACVELLFTELTLEGVPHSQFVEGSLARTASAVSELRRSLREQR
jgi:hypothetical protein